MSYLRNCEWYNICYYSFGALTITTADTTAILLLLPLLLLSPRRNAPTTTTGLTTKAWGRSKHAMGMQD